MASPKSTAPGFLGTVLSFSLRPGASFAQPRELWSRWNPILFAIAVDALARILGAASNLVLGESGTAMHDLGMTALSPLWTLMTLAISGSVLHLALRWLSRSKARFLDTVHVLALCAGPGLLSGIPLVGPIIGGIWALVIIAVGLSVVHHTTKLRAAGAMLALPMATIVLSLGLRVFVVEAFKIPAGSMIPTLEVGDHIFVNKMNKKGAYGDVVVFPFPEQPDQDFIKRVIARGGDEVRVVSGHPIINGWSVPWCDVGDYEYGAGQGSYHKGRLYVEFLGHNAYFVFIDATMMSAGDPCSSDEGCPQGQACHRGQCFDQQGPYVVPDGELFLLGDNRNNSHDSRGWHGGAGGYVPERTVRGTATLIWMSFGPAGEIAWHRIGGSPHGFTPLAAKHQKQLQDAVEACLTNRPDPVAATPP
jgi:signal peptidase I